MMLARTGPPETLYDLNRGIGRRLRTVRKARKLSQEAVGEALGVTFQQVQKYERGDNRISAASLVRFCATLDLDPAEFLAEFARPASPQDRARADWLRSRAAQDAAALFSRLPEHVQRRLLDALAALVIEGLDRMGPKP